MSSEHTSGSQVLDRGRLPAARYLDCLGRPAAGAPYQTWTSIDSQGQAPELDVGRAASPGPAEISNQSMPLPYSEESFSGLVGMGLDDRGLPSDRRCAVFSEHCLAIWLMDMWAGPNIAKVRVVKAFGSPRTHCACFLPT